MPQAPISLHLTALSVHHIHEQGITSFGGDFQAQGLPTTHGFRQGMQGLSPQVAQRCKSLICGDSIMTWEPQVVHGPGAIWEPWTLRHIPS